MGVNGNQLKHKPAYEVQCKINATQHSKVSIQLGLVLVLTEKYLEDTTGLFINETRNTLDTTTTSQTPDSWFGYALDVVTQDLPVTLGATFS